MESVIHAIFHSESDAQAARRALLDLDDDFDIEAGEIYVITKDKNGTVRTKADDDYAAGVPTVGGSLLGGLIGIIGGPVGMGVGAIAGALIGATDEAVTYDNVDDYVAAAGRSLSPGQSLLLAHLWEDRQSYVNDALAPFTSNMHRYDVDEEISRSEREEMAEINRELDEAEARADAADAADKAAWDAKVAEWKKKRDDAKARAKKKAQDRKEHYQTWVGNQKQKFANWKDTQDKKADDKKRERLQKRIADEEDRLAELHQKEAAI